MRLQILLALVTLSGSLVHALPVPLSPGLQARHSDKNESKSGAHAWDAEDDEESAQFSTRRAHATFEATSTRHLTVAEDEPEQTQGVAKTPHFSATTLTHHTEYVYEKATAASKAPHKASASPSVLGLPKIMSAPTPTAVKPKAKDAVASARTRVGAAALHVETGKASSLSIASVANETHDGASGEPDIKEKAERLPAQPIPPSVPAMSSSAAEETPSPSAAATRVKGEHGHKKEKAEGSSKKDKESRDLHNSSVPGVDSSLHHPRQEAPSSPESGNITGYIDLYGAGINSRIGLMARLGVISPDSKPQFEFDPSSWSTLTLSLIQPGSPAYTTVDTSGLKEDEMLATVSFSGAEQEQQAPGPALCAAFDPTAEDQGQLVLDKCDEENAQRSRIFVWQRSTDRLRPTWYKGQDDGQNDYGNYKKVGPDSWTVAGYPAEEDESEGSAAQDEGAAPMQPTSGMSATFPTATPTPTGIALEAAPPTETEHMLPAMIESLAVYAADTSSATFSPAETAEATPISASTESFSPSSFSYAVATAAAVSPASGSASSTIVIEEAPSATPTGDSPSASTPTPSSTATAQDADGAMMIPIALKPYDLRFIIVDEDGMATEPEIYLDPTME
ncbi:hypothetical protein PUNSTDRAFT_126102 [Punctularia strigosozonata HHB-11173 SS5]|uniref:uncharacterized protein n=1 Tax=Punctularia strigosozonata (strain HHB-11173) TaxID=741275 RepID=UPI0004416F2C|nr:uncharacterized protein PUNSTDRAFT_126102 [Punctularia strigosozonata HHB-11173 SS5]EIN08851.1 hypothetical protein PUNSTDRAFT_126102 [Punctularia strigosozonata HHB-11173 SS5]